MITKSTMHRIAVWLNGRRACDPALTIALWLSLGIKHGSMETPRDPAQFQECLDLLASVPQLRGHMMRMAKLSPAWKAMVNEWAAIEAKLLEEAALPRCPISAAMIRTAGTSLAKAS